MKKTKHDSEPKTSRSTSGEEPGGTPAPPERNGENPPENEPRAEDILDEATRWVRANQTVALIGAFGVGVFLGVLLRK